MGLLSRCTPAHLAAIRDACERDFLAFVALMFRARTGMTFRVNRHHERIADALMSVYRGDVRNLLINTPPGSSKTELAVIAFMAWCFARDPHCRFLHLSYSDDLASLNSTSAREILETEAFQQLWPLAFRRDTKAKKRWSIEAGGRTAGGVYATSTGGQVTGFRAGFMEQGFSGAIIIDDPIKPEDAWSQSKRETANRRLTNTVRSRRATDDTPVIMIMQRVHEDDPAALALSGRLGLDFEQLVIEAVPDEGGAEERSYWPDKESLEGLLALRESDPYTFSSQYQQRPTPPGGALFHPDEFRRYANLPDDLTSWAIFADTAQKTGQHNDFSVFIAAATNDRDLYIYALLRGRWEAPDLRREAVQFWHRSRIKTLRSLGMYVEDKASGTGLIQDLSRDTGIPVIPVQRSRDKVSRAYDILPYIRAGRVYIPEEAPWLTAYLGELASFSPAMTHTHDDQVDVTCDAVTVLLADAGRLGRARDFS